MQQFLAEAASPLMMINKNNSHTIIFKENNYKKIFITSI